MSGASSFLGTIQAISPGINFSPTANAWRGTGPIAKSSRAQPRGLCLLQGLLVCGICGRRLGVRYTGNGGLYPIYQCNWRHREALSRKACMSVASKPLDNAIAERLVTAVTPLRSELALEALTSMEERDKAIAAQWRRRIERARYDVDLAERRYEAVDPANRLIASTLEKRWNDAMQRLLELEAEWANFERQTLRTITAEQKRQILQLARDQPAGVFPAFRWQLGARCSLDRCDNSRAAGVRFDHSFQANPLWIAHFVAPRCCPRIKSS